VLTKLECRYAGANPRRWDFPIFPEEQEHAMSKKTIVIVGADKGGVGKTTITRALIDYLEKIPVAIRAFDTEPGTVGVLKRFYPAATMLNGSAVAGQKAIVDEASSEAPYLDEMACAAVDHASVGFTAFVNTLAQSRVLRGHVRAWLGDVHAAFDQAGIAKMLKAA
jgi:hypothetical protein